tara:strand:- start:732 stop:890 length:159 start_codon:yes stop_codon:yes gene_type:complete
VRFLEKATAFFFFFLSSFSKGKIQKYCIGKNEKDVKTNETDARVTFDVFKYF